MPEQLQLEVVTPERRVLAESVDMVTVPGLGGELGILPGHTPLISQLQTGVLAFVKEGQTQQLHVSGGFVEVNDDRVSVLANVAERPEEIDPVRAREAREIAEKRLRDQTGIDIDRAYAKLTRNLLRLQLAAGVPRT